MTEKEWLSSTDPNIIYLPKLPFTVDLMLRSLCHLFNADKTTWGKRKLRLFACACCRRHWTSLTEWGRTAVELAERFADGKASKQERWDYHKRWYNERNNARTLERSIITADDQIASEILNKQEHTAAWVAANGCYTLFCETPRYPQELGGEILCQAALIHEVFGNPFQPITIDPGLLAWKQATIQLLAQSIYEDRNFQALPILADALEEAGCTNRALIDHCYSEGPHVRGCWVIDLMRSVE